MVVSVLYLAICVAVMASVLVWGAPELSILVGAAALLVAVLGVPHGGLDHWTGRRLLASRFRHPWWLLFFPGYLAVGWVVALSWFALPIATVIGFFLLSAWHFGREDQQHDAKTTGTKHTSGPLRHVEAIALGGLVIWVPALVHPSEMQSLLTLILPSSDGGEAGQIVWLTQSLAWIFCPIACLMSLRQWTLQGRDLNAWVPLATAGIAASAPILVSFTAYFCLWHSILGLMRLRSEEGLTVRQFIAATMPLSAMAVAGVVAISWLFRNSFGGAAMGSVPASLQMLFIGLSAIAVPHLLLHEWAAAVRGETDRAEVPC